MHMGCNSARAVDGVEWPWQRHGVDSATVVSFWPASPPLPPPLPVAKAHVNCWASRRHRVWHRRRHSGLICGCLLVSTPLAASNDAYQPHAVIAAVDRHRAFQIQCPAVCRAQAAVQICSGASGLRRIRSLLLSIKWRNFLAEEKGGIGEEEDKE